MDSPPRFTRPWLAFAIGVPLAWAVLLWFHPDVDPDDVYGSLQDNVTTYLVVHVGTLIFIGLMGAALYVLVRGMPGTAAKVSRLAIGPFVLLYGAWEAVIGIAIGVMVEHGNDAPLGQRPAVAETIQSVGEQWDHWGRRNRGHRRSACVGRGCDRGGCGIPQCGRAHTGLGAARDCRCSWPHTRRPSGRSGWCSSPLPWHCWHAASGSRRPQRERRRCPRPGWARPSGPPGRSPPPRRAPPPAAPGWTAARRRCCGWRRRSPD